MQVKGPAILDPLHLHQTPGSPPLSPDPGCPPSLCPCSLWIHALGPPTRSLLPHRGISSSHLHGNTHHPAHKATVHEAPWRSMQLATRFAVGDAHTPAQGVTQSSCAFLPCLHRPGVTVRSVVCTPAGAGGVHRCTSAVCDRHRCRKHNSSSDSSLWGNQPPAHD